MRLKIYFSLLVFCLFITHSHAQPTAVRPISARLTAARQLSDDLLQKPWKAQWITGPGRPINRFTASSDLSLKDYGIYKFRKTIELAAKPASFVVHVSGDNRYKLFVNGKHVSQGPARGDLYFWNFETVDIAPFLNAGSNIVSAVVWNEGRSKPESQISYLTGFILQGNTAAEEILNTNESWKTIKDESYQPLSVKVPGYYVAGPAELVDMNSHVSGWEKAEYDDSKWVKARADRSGCDQGCGSEFVGLDAGTIADSTDGNDGSAPFSNQEIRRRTGSGRISCNEKKRNDTCQYEGNDLAGSGIFDQCLPNA